MANQRWENVILSAEQKWPLFFGDVYDTLNLLTHGKGLGNDVPDLLAELIPLQVFFKDETRRNAFISSMPEEYIVGLSSNLGLNGRTIGEMIQKLKGIKYTTKVEKIFLNYFGEEPAPKPREETVVGVETIYENNVAYPLRDYQRQVVRDLESILSDGGRRCMVQMPTGSGKTRTAMYFISEMINSNDCYSVLWLAYSKELCEQASDEFSKIWRVRGNKASQIYRFYGNSDCELPRKKINGIIVTTLSKVLSARKKDETVMAMLANKIDLVVFDEAHQIIAPEYESIVKEIIDLNRNSKLIGLTATPGRTWNNPEEDEKLSKFFNKNIVPIKTENGETPNEMLTRRGYLSKIKWVLCDIETPILKSTEVDLIKQLREEEELPKNILRQISSDAMRNVRIISETEKLLSDGKKRILVFSTDLPHARDLSILLKRLSGEYGCKVDYIAGDTDP